MKSVKKAWFTLPMIRKAIGRTERKDIVIYLPKYTIMYFRVYDTHTITTNNIFTDTYIYTYQIKI